MQLATRFARFEQDAQRIEARDGYIADEALRAACPSIFAAAKHDSRSARYTYIPTSDIVRGMISQGFFPVSACQSRSRVEGKENFTKHMIRFRRDHDLRAVQALTTRTDHIVNRSQPLAEFPEIVLVNSHDGSSSYQLFGGFFRLVCRNGLIVSTETIAETRIHHKGNILESVVEGAHDLLTRLPVAQERIGAMKSLTLSPAEARVLAEGAIDLRFEPEAGAKAPVTPDQVLKPQREEDTASDLWTIFNRIQERIVKGGVRGVTGKTREVKGIDQNVRLNRNLWAMAEKMAALKS